MDTPPTEENTMPNITTREAALDYLLASQCQAVARTQRQLHPSARVEYVAYQGQQFHEAMHRLGVTEDELGGAYGRVNEDVDRLLRKHVPSFQPPAEGGPLTEAMREGRA